jgi:GNAT superfamily N-acetyltransferase
MCGSNAIPLGMAELEIAYLVDRLDAAPLLAAWFAAEWGDGSPGMQPQAIAQRLVSQASRKRLPICLLGLAGGAPVATAMLKYREIDYAPRADHWLGSVYVLDDMRGRGYGRAIVAAAEATAASAGLLPLYLYTPYKESLYVRLGWQTVGTMVAGGKQAAVMVRLTSSSSTSARPVC